MIKLEIDKAKQKNIRDTHIKKLRDNILDKINIQINNCQDQDYYRLLDYFKVNLEKILGGDRDVLRKIISEIENNYFISDTKLNSILNLNNKVDFRKFSKHEKETHIKQFSTKHNISNFIDSNKSYSSIKSFEKFINKLKDKWKDWKKRIFEIFDYKSFTQDYTGWGAYKLVSALNIEVCPYCNRQFIHTMENKDKKARATLDHFYSKSLYPYLALSFYNLIPSCYFCNSSLKGNEDFYTNEAIYPYDEQFSDNARFKIDSDNYLYLLGLSQEFDIKIDLKTNISKEIEDKIKRSISVFALDEMYKFHKDYICDLLRSAYINSESRINELYNAYPKLFDSKEELMQSLFLNYFTEDELGKRVLAKLTRDICLQLGLIK